MKKKILGIAGSMKTGNSSSAYLLTRALDRAAEFDIETEQIRLKDYRILPCEGCGSCMNNQPCLLLNHPEDELGKLYEKLVRADGFIFSSPVYALSLPAIWKNWIDRCEPCSPQDLSYAYYNYDRVVAVKGKALKGKVAGFICVAAGPGSEWALASLLPAFTAVKLSMVACAGMSLIEYDGQPGISKHSWSRPVAEADFAIRMAEAVGERVATALGYSTFDAARETGEPAGASVMKEIIEETMEGTMEEAGEKAMKETVVLDFNDCPHTLAELSREKDTVFIAGGINAGAESRQLYDRLRSVPGKNPVLIACIGKTPPFITRDFIRSKVKESAEARTVYFDWDNVTGLMLDKSLDHPVLLSFSHNKN